MANRKIYNQIGVFAGTTSSDGYHFATPSGYLTNSIYSDLGNGLSGYSNNLIYSLNRIVNAEYGFNESRVDIKSFGNYGTLARPIITTPPISLNLSYYSMGLVNEQILGLTLSSGNNIPIISGLTNRFYFPNSYNDSRNIFVATNDNELDLNFLTPTTQTLNSTTGQILNNNIHVYSFGDCYLDSYKYSAAVGKFPQVDTSFICENIMYYSGSSGNNIPSINPLDFSLRTGVTYNLPSIYTGIEPTILLPGDITTNITEAGGNNALQNLPISFTDIKLQSFDIDISLTRDTLNNFGYRIPMDRPINPPIFANLSFSTIVGNSETGSFFSFINNDTNYNIDIYMMYSSKQPITGVGINFKFLNSKFNNISISESIDQKRLCNFSFVTELSPYNISQGLFISGQQNPNRTILFPKYPNPSQFLITGSGMSSSQILINWGQSNSPYPITYNLYRNSNPNFYPLLSNNIANNLISYNYIDSNLNQNSTYYYYGESQDIYGLYTISNLGSGTTFSTPPGTFSLSASPESVGQINLIWTNATGVNITYSLYSGSITGFIFSSNNIIANALTGNSFNHIDLNPNFTYYYIGTANNTAVSTSSNETNSTTFAPPILTGSGISTSSISLSWNNPVGTIYSNIYQNSGNIGFTPNIGSLLITGITGNSYISTGLISSTTYYDYVQAIASGGSGLSNELSSITFAPLPPVILIINPSSISSVISSSPFSINITGQYFTNIGNETVYISGISGTTGDIRDGYLTYISTGNVIAYFSGIYESAHIQEFSTIYTSNNGQSNTGITLQITPCIPASITGFTPNIIPNMGSSSFNINFFGSGFTNNGNERLTINNSGLIYSGIPYYFNSNHISGNFTGGSYNIGFYSGYYTNNCYNSLFTGLIIESNLVNLIPIMTGNITTSGIASASSTRDGTIFAYLAFDQYPVDAWIANSYAPPSQWVQYQFLIPTAAQATSYSISDIADPSSWQLEGSNDGILWTVLDTQTNQPDPLPYASYNISISSFYSYYRLNITASNPAYSFVSAKLQLSGYYY